MNDVELLQRFEPIVRYTEGELFFPTGVEQYVHHASLWMRTPGGQDQQLVPPGQLTLDELARHSEVPEGHTLYMNLVDEPLTGLAYQRWRNRPERDVFHSAGRLARVPLTFRIVDSLFDLTFLVRGQVPGGFTAAAQVTYEALHELDPRRVYFGRVVRDNGWIVLQYLFFMTMNDWRSSFHGVPTTHETDWEQIFVYVFENEQGQLEPRWVAYASHDFKGDDLRRRWDDPLLDKKGTHPVVYAGAGSHASYFEAGEYLVGITPQFLKPAEHYVQRIRRFWYEQLRMGRQDQPSDSARSRPLLSIPHIDYARGDGKSIGPGQPEQWSPVLISDDVPWVDKYRGLWGLETGDFIGGERRALWPQIQPRRLGAPVMVRSIGLGRHGQGANTSPGSAEDAGAHRRTGTAFASVGRTHRRFAPNCGADRDGYHVATQFGVWRVNSQGKGPPGQRRAQVSGQRCSANA